MFLGCVLFGHRTLSVRSLLFLSPPYVNLGSRDGLPLLCRGVTVPDQSGGLLEQLGGRLLLQPLHDNAPESRTLLQPALTASQSEAQPADLLRPLVRLQEPSDGLHCSQDPPRMVAQGDVEMKQRLLNRIGPPCRDTAGGRSHGDDRPLSRNTHRLRHGGRRGGGRGPGLGEQASGRQDSCVEAVPLAAFPGDLGAELHGAPAPGTVIEADPMDVAALGKDAGGDAYAGPQDGLPRAALPVDGPGSVEVDQEGASVLHVDQHSGSERLGVGEIGRDALFAQPGCQVGLGEQVVGAVLAALIAAARRAVPAAPVVGEVADLVSAPPGHELTAATPSNLVPHQMGTSSYSRRNASSSSGVSGHSAGSSESGLPKTAVRMRRRSILLPLLQTNDCPTLCSRALTLPFRSGQLAQLAALLRAHQPWSGLWSGGATTARGRRREPGGISVPGRRAPAPAMRARAAVSRCPALCAEPIGDDGGGCVQCGPQGLVERRKGPLGPVGVRVVVDDRGEQFFYCLREPGLRAPEQGCDGRREPVEGHGQPRRRCRALAIPSSLLRQGLTAANGDI